MGEWRRRVRAAIGIGLTWAAAWFGAGMILLVVVGPDAADVPFPLFFGLLGFIAGAAFSTILGTLGRRRRFGAMSMPRFAGWGALAGVLLTVVVTLGAGATGDLLFLAPLFAAAGAISATGTLALARRAEGAALPGARERERLGEGGEG